MTRFIQGPGTDPHWNLALEQYVFDRLDRAYGYFMLWQNDNAVIVGRHQNTAAELDADFVRENGIRVARRLSGGGAVYHDLGNVNFTFIADTEEDRFDLTAFMEPVLRALRALGLPVQMSGRNDMTLDGKKFSGSAMYIKDGRLMHHGTLLYDSDLDTLSRALRVSPGKFESKAVASVRSRVCNLRPYMPSPLSTEAFIQALRGGIFREAELEEYRLTQDDLRHIGTLRDSVYSTWAWNYGASPAYALRKARRFEGCGTVEVHMRVEDGAIADMRFYGDFFARLDPAALARLLTGAEPSRDGLRRALAGAPVGDYFNGLDEERFLELMLS